MKAAKLDWMGVFEYSDVDNAGSYGLDAKVDAETITERRETTDGDPEEDFARETARIQGSRRRRRWSKGRRKTIRWCGKRGWKAWRRISTASFI